VSRLPQKERFQFRPAGARYRFFADPTDGHAVAAPADDSAEPPAPSHFPARYRLGEADPVLQAALFEVTTLLQRVASVALSGLLAGIGADPRAVFGQHCDESGLPGWPRKSSHSVLNCYHYLNHASSCSDTAPTDTASAECGDSGPGAGGTTTAGSGGGGGDEIGGKDGGVAARSAVRAPPSCGPNCNEHTDPGLITVLGRGTAKGLQMSHTRRHGPRCTGDLAYDDASDGAAVDEPVGDAQWVFAEPMMACNQVCVLVGESLYRGSGGVLPACLHRVVNCPGEPRQNLIFELRPHTAIFGSLVTDPAVGSTAAAHAAT